MAGRQLEGTERRQQRSAMLRRGYAPEHLLDERDSGPQWTVLHEEGGGQCRTASSHGFVAAKRGALRSTDEVVLLTNESGHGRGGLEKRCEPVSMSLCDGFGVGQLLTGEHLHADEHRQPTSRVDDEQALVDEFGEQVLDERSVFTALDDVVCRLDGESTLEHRQLCENPLLEWSEQLPAPSQRGAQRSLPLVDVVRVAAQNLEPAGHPFEQGDRRQQATTGGREFDSQRKTIEQLDQLAHLGGERVQFEPHARLSGALGEEFDRLVAREHIEGVEMLAVQPEWGAAGHQHVESRGHVEPVGDRVGAECAQLLEVVEDQQRVASSLEATSDLLDGICSQGHTECATHRAREAFGRTNVGQGHEGDSLELGVEA